MKLHELIAEQTATDPAGKVWTVGIRWLPRRPKWLGWGPGRNRNAGKSMRDSDNRKSRWYDGLDVGVPDADFPGILVIIAIIVAIVFAWFFILPIAFFALDLLLLLIIAAGAVAARVLLRRPWIVEATAGDEVLRWRVVGYRVSKEVVGEIATDITRGTPL